MKLLVTILEMQMTSEQSTHELPNTTTFFYHQQSESGTPFLKNREPRLLFCPAYRSIITPEIASHKYYILAFIPNAVVLTMTSILEILQIHHFAHVAISKHPSITFCNAVGITCNDTRCKVTSHTYAKYL